MDGIESSLPASVAFTATGALTTTWAGSTTDSRALENEAGTGRGRRCLVLCHQLHR